MPNITIWGSYNFIFRVFVCLFPRQGFSTFAEKMLGRFMLTSDTGVPFSTSSTPFSALTIVLDISSTHSIYQNCSRLLIFSRSWWPWNPPHACVCTLWVRYLQTPFACFLLYCLVLNTQLFSVCFLACGFFFLMCIYLCAGNGREYAWMQVLRAASEDIRSPGAGVTGGAHLLLWGWELNTVLWQSSLHS